jgi:hypothetical protein
MAHDHRHRHQDAEVDVWGLAGFDPAHLGVGQARSRSEATGAQTSRDARGPELGPDPEEQVPSAVSAALADGLVGRHDAIVPIAP